MATVTPLVFRWGIISTGSIAGCFVRDALVDPKTVQKAQEFINRETNADKSVKAYGSHEELLADPDVDAVYIGTPHTYHYLNARSSLLAKKHVLCEKPVTSNAAELHSLLAIAKEQNVFFMEAMWTRFQPLVREIKDLAEKGDLGAPVVMHADLSGDFDIENIPKTHRILDPMLGGGGLLDLGPYPLIWAIVTLYEHPSNNNSRPTQISGSMLKTPLTGVDSSTAFSLTFSESELRAQAVLSTSINLPAQVPGVNIRYRNGNILVQPPIYCPTTYTVQYFDKPGSGVVVREEKRTVKYEGRGWHFQADEVARCVRDGKLESDLWGHEKSLLEMDIFDEVRRQGGYKFPEGVEQVV